MPRFDLFPDWPRLAIVADNGDLLLRDGGGIFALTPGGEVEELFTYPDPHWVLVDGMMTRELGHPSRRIELKLLAGSNIVGAQEIFFCEQTILNGEPTPLEILWSQRWRLGPVFCTPQTELAPAAVSYFDDRDNPILRMRWPFTHDGLDLAHLMTPANAAIQTLHITDFTADAATLFELNSPTARFSMRWDVTRFPYLRVARTATGFSIGPSCGLPNALQDGHGTLKVPPGGELKMRVEFIFG